MTDALDVLVDAYLERTALGHLLAYGLWPSYDEAGLTREDFHQGHHRRILEAVIAVHDAGAVADIVAVVQRLRQVGALDEVGVGYVSGLIDGVQRPGPENILLVVSRLQELAAGRLVFYAAQEVQARLREPGAISDGALTKYLDVVQAVVEKQHTGAVPWLDVEGQLRAHAHDTHLSQGWRVFFGLPALDEVVGGVRAGEVCGLMGRPGIGKTVFLAHIARAVTENSGHVLFSIEMPGSQIVGRLKQMVYNVGRYELERAARYEQLDDDAYRSAFRNLVIVDTPGLSVAEMGRRVRQIQRGPLRDVPIRLITVDHLGLIGGDRGLSTYDRVSTQAREVKELAKRMAAGVLLAIQVNREAGGDGSRELGLGSARDSGVVEEAMDYLVGIRRLDRSVTLSAFEREKYRDVIFAKVIKNRHGDPHAHEVAYRFHPVGLTLHEDPSLQADENDISKIAAARGSRR